MAPTSTAGASVKSTEKITPQKKLVVANRSASRGENRRRKSSVIQPPVKQTLAMIPYKTMPITANRGEPGNPNSLLENI